MRIILLAVLSMTTVAIYANGFALLIGANMIRTGAYVSSYSASAVKGAESDVQKMKEILESSGFSNIQTLIGKHATKEEILSELIRFRSILKKDDVFVFFYSGHGDTLNDSNADEVPYTFDQAFVTYDKFLVDDELNKIWKSFPSGIKIYQVVDACYSGEMYKIFSSESLSEKRSFIKSSELEKSSLGANLCNGLDATQLYNMYYVASALKDRTTSSTASGEGILTNDIYSAFVKLRKENKLQLITAAEFFSVVCSGTNRFIFLKIYSVLDIFKNDYLFKL